MSSSLATVSAFVEGAPPGELADVIADIKALTIDTPTLVSQLGPAFEKYNEEQFATVKLPGSSQHVSLGYMAEMGSMLILLRKGHSQLAQLSWGWKILRC